MWSIDQTDRSLSIRFRNINQRCFAGGPTLKCLLDRFLYLRAIKNTNHVNMRALAIIILLIELFNIIDRQALQHLFARIESAIGMIGIEQLAKSLVRERVG